MSWHIAIYGQYDPGRPPGRIPNNDRLHSSAYKGVSNQTNERCIIIHANIIERRHDALDDIWYFNIGRSDNTMECHLGHLEPWDDRPNC